MKEVALKIYKDQEFRNFRNDADYLGGRVWKRRDLLHLKSVKDQIWVETEYAVLSRLWEDGVRVPRPYERIDQGIIMEHIAGPDGTAPPLKDVRLVGEDRRRAFDEVMIAMDAMLRAGVVHGDLSAFNILYDGEHPVVIDFPQAVNIHTHPDPFSLFVRDVENVLRYFSDCGDSGPWSCAKEMWERHYRWEPQLVR